MHNEVNIRRIENKFNELINLEENGTKAQPTLNNPFQLEDAFSKVLSRQTTNKTQLVETQKGQNPNEGDELIFTKSDICREVAKLKPYLRKFAETQTSVELEDRANKRISDEEQNSLSELVIYLNRQLCEKLRGIQEVGSRDMVRQSKQKEGWVYEVFYRFRPSQQAAELPHSQFRNGYALLTQVLSVYTNLTFEQALLQVNINQIKRVKYTQEREYQVIEIRFGDMTLHVGFLSDAQMRLFDRMLFLLKNMARTSSTRLFQNQLLKNIYSEY